MDRYRARQDVVEINDRFYKKVQFRTFYEKAKVILHDEAALEMAKKIFDEGQTIELDHLSLDQVMLFSRAMLTRYISELIAYISHVKQYSKGKVGVIITMNAEGVLSFSTESNAWITDCNLTREHHLPEWIMASPYNSYIFREMMHYLRGTVKARVRWYPHYRTIDSSKSWKRAKIAVTFDE